MKVSIAKTFHLNAQIASGPASQIAPELQFKSDDGQEPFLLAFVEQTPDGSHEAHFYPLDEGGKQNLIRHLSGGVVPVGVEALKDLPKMAVPRGR